MLDKKGPNSILKYSVAQKPKISDLKIKSLVTYVKQSKGVLNSSSSYRIILLTAKKRWSSRQLLNEIREAKGEGIGANPSQRENSLKNE